MLMSSNFALQTKSKIGKRGNDADANELVTGHRCW